MMKENMKRRTLLTGDEIAELNANEMIEALEEAKRSYPHANIFFERDDYAEEGEANISLIVAQRG